MQGYVHSIESFGTVDGPGIRMVVFLQGCPMRCLYCHNPDTWKTGTGTLMSVEDLLERYESKKSFYRNGGLTVTGGEPLLQIDFVTALFTEAKKRGIHTCLDTSGITFPTGRGADTGKFDALIRVTDLVMLDIKHIDDKAHIQLTSQSNLPVLSFARYLDDHGVSMWIRHVVVPGITDSPEALTRLGKYLATLHHIKVLDVLPYHTMGEVKYEALGLEYPLKGVSPLSKAEAIKAKQIIISSFSKSHKKA